MSKKVGRPQKEIDYKMLDGLIAIMCTGEECAGVMSMDYDTLNACLKRDGNVNFSDYFKKKSGFGKMSLRRSQFNLARDGNATMLVWLGKQYLGQKDKIENDTISSDGSMTPKRIIRMYVKEGEVAED